MNNQIFHSDFDGGLQFTLLELFDEVVDMIIQILGIVLLSLFVQDMILNQSLLPDFIRYGNHKVSAHTVLWARVEKPAGDKERVVKLSEQLISNAVG